MIMIRYVLSIGVLVAVFFTILGGVSIAPADVFLLKEGGRLEGEFLNAEEVPRRTYRIEATAGMEFEIESKHIERSRKGDREALIEYNAFAPFMEDTVENHLEIADWCSKNQLPELARRHRYLVLEHDPENKPARQTLGYFKDKDGNWTTQEEMLGRKGGLIQHRNSWKSQQQIEVEQLLENRKKKETTWTNKIAELRSSLPRGEKARSEMLSIKDPAAVEPLWIALKEERNEDTRVLIIKALSNIGTSVAVHNVARWSLNVGEHLELRKTCYDEIRRHPEAKQAIVAFYENFLGDVARPQIINAAAMGIGEIDGHTAVPKLIDALVTVHKYKATEKAPGPAFGNFGNVQGGGLAWGQNTVEKVNRSENREVRAALMRLTGVDFQFDKDAWRAWLIQQRRTSSFNARRG